MATAGTLEDENIENQPKDRPLPSSAVGIGSITLLQSVDSEDEEELEELEVVRASAAQIERPQKKDEKWKNPTKILKRTEPQEKKLAIPKTMRSSEWKLAIVTEDIEVDNKESKKEEETVVV
jgi:hypothetical protein